MILFLYGTLMPDLLPDFLRDIGPRMRPLGLGAVSGQMFDMGGHPGAVLDDEGSPIVGQLVEIPDDPDLIRRLDDYEGFDPERPEPSLYVRRPCEVTTEASDRIAASVYEYRGETEGRSIIPDGDYRKWRGR